MNDGEQRVGRGRWPVMWAMVWAVAYGGFAVGCLLTGAPVFALADHAGPGWFGWFAVSAALLGGVGAWTGRRSLLWAGGALCAVSAFGLLMDVITLVFGQWTDSAVAAVNHAFGALGVVLLAAAGPARVRAGGPVPDRRPMAAAWAGAAGFVPYVVMKATWVAGGTFAGVGGAEMTDIYERNGASGLWLALESWGIDGTVLLAVLGVFLLFGLVRPWGEIFPRRVPGLRGRRVPRWLPLAPALLGGATLAPYGLFGVVYAALGSAGVLTVPRGDFPSSSDALLAAWIGLTAFAVYGVALLVAAHSYWLRTRVVPGVVFTDGSAAN